MEGQAFHLAVKMPASHTWSPEFNFRPGSGHQLPANADPGGSRGGACMGDLESTPSSGSSPGAAPAVTGI